MASPGPAPAACRWWDQRPALARYLQDLVADELARLRPGQARAMPVPYPTVTPDLRRTPEAQQTPGLHPWDAPLEVDSLELMDLATALSVSIHLHESGIEDYLLARRSLRQWIDIASAGLDVYSQRLTFRTSGSTGEPKPCEHALSTLMQEIAELTPLFPGRRRVLSAVASHHIYGFLFTVLLPPAMDIAEADVVDLRASAPAALAALARPGDLIVAHPAWWAAAAGVDMRLPPDVVGVTSTGPCEEAVADALTHAGLAGLVQMYGSSETAGIGWRRSHREPYRLFAYWTFGGEADAPTLLRRLPEGGEATVQAAPDCIVVEPDGRHFAVGARRDAAVQVGGINVFPQQVAEALRRHPKVADAAVRLMRPQEGRRLKAFIVPAAPGGDRAALQRELTAWIDRTLGVAQRPRSLTFGSALPVTAAGKPCDWVIAPPAA